MMPIRDYKRDRKQLDNKRNRELPKIAALDDVEFTILYETAYARACDRLEAKCFGVPLVTQVGQVDTPARFWAHINLVYLQACKITGVFGKDSYTLKDIYKLAEELDLNKLIPDSWETYRSHDELLVRLSRMSDALEQMEIDEAKASSQTQLELDAATMPTTQQPPPPSRRTGGPKVQKRSWTQKDLDAEILAYKANRASNYNELVQRVQRGDKGAMKAAQQMFGRNAIVKALGVKSPTMVTKSPSWQSIRDDFGFSGPHQVFHITPTKKIGLEIAIERRAEPNHDQVVNEVFRKETIRLIQKQLQNQSGAELIDQLERGLCSDDRARQIIMITADQQRDRRSDKVIIQ